MSFDETIEFERGLPGLRLELERFLRHMGPGDRAAAIHDADADGLSAGVIWQRAMERRGFRNITRLAVDRERSAWADSNRARIAEIGPRSLFVIDLGSLPEPIVEGVRTCIIDHHRPDGVPPGGLLLSGYRLRPIPTSSCLVHELFRDHANLDDLVWIAALGIQGDLGPAAPFELLRRARAEHGSKALAEAVALVNAPRRSSSCDPEAAARALLDHPGPRDLVRSRSEDVEVLRRARDEVRRELVEAKKTAPRFSGRVALLALRSPCQVHPIIARIWRDRLPKYIVIAANDGWTPGRVSFSVRSASCDDLIGFLRALELDPGEGTFAGGHDSATGGSLEPKRWAELLGKLGFDASSTRSPPRARPARPGFR